MMSLTLEYPKLKLIKVNEREVRKDFPKFFPLNEWTFKSFLIRHPEYIYKGLEFIGYEICYVDLIFKKDDKLVLVEAKCINPNENSEFKVKEAMRQLINYLNKFRLVCDSKNIVPVIALMKKSNAKLRMPNLETLWRRRCEKELKVERYLNDLQNKIQSAERRLSKLNMKVGERLTELRLLKNRKYPVNIGKRSISVEAEDQIIMEKLLRGEI